MPQIKKIHLSFTANISRSLPVVCYYSGLPYHSCRTKPSDAEREAAPLPFGLHNLNNGSVPQTRYFVVSMTESR